MKMTVEILTEAIKEYRTEGKELMQRLGQKFGYDISIPEEYDELIRRGNPKVPMSGKISERVNYAFHGGECGFHKRKTQQNVEVILTNSPEFGKIDTWFLKAFLESTKKYSELSSDLDWQDLKPMVNELYRKGLIEDVK